jgi:hypothetical protein
VSSGGVRTPGTGGSQDPEPDRGDGGAELLVVALVVEVLAVAGASRVGTGPRTPQAQARTTSPVTPDAALVLCLGSVQFGLDRGDGVLVVYRVPA